MGRRKGGLELKGKDGEIEGECGDGIRDKREGGFRER